MSETNPKIFTYLPLSVDPPLTDLSKFFSNLGKATKRGIKKCFKCGIYNGTRGIVCKNKHCDAILKDCSDKRKLNLDAVKLFGIVRQVYSVRVQDRGPDYRGFVQLPLLPTREGERITENALCFVDSCQRLFDDSILKCHEIDNIYSSPLCIHINSALKSRELATPLEFKKEILNSLNVSKEIKENLWLLATEKEGPLVQRVSRTVMAVKCQVSPKHPLGYLHFTFGSHKSRDIFDKYYCSCTEFMVSGSKNMRIKCIHYYACICVLKSDSSFHEKFEHFIQLEFQRQESLVMDLWSNKVVLKTKPDTKKLNKPKKQKIKFTRNQKKIFPKIYPVQIKILNGPASTEISKEVTWKFQNWLSYVTESINKTMQFENYAILNTLVFHIPEVFFSELAERIPNIYQEPIENVQMFRKVYNIMNILHLKQIFDTSEIKLKISKRFIHDSQKGYVEYNEDDDNENCQPNFIFFLNVGQSTVDESDNTNNSFMIEWIDNISNVTKMGQLKFQYKYGRKSI